MLVRLDRRIEILERALFTVHIELVIGFLMCIRAQRRREMRLRIWTDFYARRRWLGPRIARRRVLGQFERLGNEVVREE